MAEPRYTRPPEPHPDLGFWAWLGEWGRIHPVRAAICVFCLIWLAFLVVAGISLLF